LYVQYGNRHAKDAVEGKRDIWMNILICILPVSFTFYHCIIHHMQMGVA
jgi:hypothetical protein